MTKNTCVTHDVLVDFLYGGGDDETRRRVEAHLVACVSCTEELRGLNEVRGELASWVPPEVPLGFRLVSDALYDYSPEDGQPLGDFPEVFPLAWSPPQR